MNKSPGRATCSFAGCKRERPRAREMPLKPPCPLKNLPKGRNLYHVHFEIISDIIGDANVIGSSPSEISVPISL